MMSTRGVINWSRMVAVNSCKEFGEIFPQRRRNGGYQKRGTVVEEEEEEVGGRSLMKLQLLRRYRRR